MAWNEVITQFTTATKNHADNFNDVNNKLLENDKYIKEKVEQIEVVNATQGTEINNLKTTKVDNSTFTTYTAEQTAKNTAQDTEINNLKTSKLNSSTFTSFSTEQEAKDLAQNVEINKAKNMLTLDTQSKSNFDFIQNKVVQDGLGSITQSIVSTKLLNNLYTVGTNALSIVFNGIVVKSIGGLTSEYIFSTTSGLLKIYVDSTSKLNIFYYNQTSFVINTGYTVKVGTPFDINISINDSTLIYSVGDINCSVLMTTSCKNLTASNSCYILGEYNGTKPLNASINNILIYNRTLTQAEINHNFNVLNNSPSTSQLTVTDSTGTKMPLLFSSDTSHVEARGGVLQDQINADFYKQFCKEFTSDGSDITVANGMRGYVNSFNMSGQTVKNVNNFEWLNISTHAIGRLVGSELNKKYTVYNVNPTTYEFAVLQNGAYLTPNKTYTTLDRFEITSNGNSNIEFYFRRIDKANLTSSDMLFKNNYIVCEGVVLQPTMTIIPFGLSSTKASISNNGIKYNFYLADGSAIDLGGLAAIKNTLEGKEDGSLLYTQNTKEITLTATTTTLTDYKASTPILASQNATIAGNVVTGVVGEVVRYQLATPVVTTIAKEKVPCVLTADKSNILAFGEGVKPSSVKVNVPVNMVADLVTRVARLESLHL